MMNRLTKKSSKLLTATADFRRCTTFQSEIINLLHSLNLKLCGDFFGDIPVFVKDASQISKSTLLYKRIFLKRLQQQIQLSMIGIMERVKRVEKRSCHATSESQALCIMPPGLLMAILVLIVLDE